MAAHRLELHSTPGGILYECCEKGHDWAAPVTDLNDVLTAKKAHDESLRESLVPGLYLVQTVDKAVLYRMRLDRAAQQEWLVARWSTPNHIGGPHPDHLELLVDLNSGYELAP